MHAVLHEEGFGGYFLYGINYYITDGRIFLDIPYNP